MEILESKDVSINVKVRKIEQVNKVPVLKIDKNVGFCKDCGSLVKNISGFVKCEVCGNDDNMNLFEGVIAEKLNAYFKISHDGLLKKYSRSRGLLVKKSYSNKAVAWNLMIMDGYTKEDDGEMKDLLNRIFWSRFT